MAPSLFGQPENFPICIGFRKPGIPGIKVDCSNIAAEIITVLAHIPS